MLTLREALKDIIKDEEFLNSTLLDDGANDWYAETLLEEIESNGTDEEIDECLNQEVCWGENGIYKINDEGYRESIPMYAFHEAKMSDTSYELVRVDKLDSYLNSLDEEEE